MTVLARPGLDENKKKYERELMLAAQESVDAINPLASFVVLGEMARSDVIKKIRAGIPRTELATRSCLFCPTSMTTRSHASEANASRNKFGLKAVMIRESPPPSNLTRTLPELTETGRLPTPSSEETLQPRKTMSEP